MTTPHDEQPVDGDSLTATIHVTAYGAGLNVDEVVALTWPERALVTSVLVTVAGLATAGVLTGRMISGATGTIRSLVWRHTSR